MEHEEPNLLTHPRAGITSWSQYSFQLDIGTALQFFSS